MAEIGETLRDARMRARIDVSEIEAKTKIRAKYLRALENEEWGLLPGPTFVKSFLRTYAQALGLDGKALVEEYRLSHEHLNDAALEPIVSSPQQPARAPRVGRASPGRGGGQPSRGLHADGGGRGARDRAAPGRASERRRQRLPQAGEQQHDDPPQPPPLAATGAAGHAPARHRSRRSSRCRCGRRHRCTCA